MEKDDEPRFLHLLQPNKDLAANWTVDVARELEVYLSQLASTLKDAGHDSFNFAEAALLIQGSIQVYSRKVEYLYALVIQALEFIAQKKEAQKENSSIQDNGKDADIIEDPEEEFLNLDDVPEESNIDLVDEDNGSSVAPAVKPPACLLVIEGDTIDISGDAGELASYQISTSSLHRDFLLLDPCDAKFVDEYWLANEKGKSNGTPGKPPASAHKTPRSTGTTPGRKTTYGEDDDILGPPGSSVKNHNSPGIHDANACDGAMHDWHDDGNEGPVAWEGEYTEGGETGMHPQKEVDANGSSNMPREYQSNDQLEDDEMDPWAPLNPHEPGTLPVVPYKRGKPRKRKQKKKRESLLEAALPKVGKVWQALENLEREMMRAKQTEELPPYEKLRSSFGGKEVEAFTSNLDVDKSDKGSDSEDGGSEDGRMEDAEPDHVYEPDFVDDFGSQDPSHLNSFAMDHSTVTFSDKGAGEALSSLEDLCQAHLDAILKNHSGPEHHTEIANRVTGWKQKIERNLAIQDSHPPFDIHVYGERVLDKLSSEVEDEDEDPSGVELTFTEVVSGLEKHEVARTFAALLQLVNNGNVALEKRSEGSLPTCFTAEKPFAVKLLSCRRRHEEMLHYRAPSSRAIKGSTRKNRKSGMFSQEPLLELEDENIFGGQANLLTTPPGRPLPNKSKRRSAGLWKPDMDISSDLKSIVSPKSTTPDGKRRRRRQSLKPVQVRLAA